MKKNTRATWIEGAAVVGLIAASATAQTVVYDNSANPLNSYFASQTEFGDQITLGGTERFAHTFTFEYYATGLSGGETARVRFWRNDGVPIEGTSAQAPGSLIYQSPSFPISDGNFPIPITDLAALNIALPDSFTWTVSVTGVEGAEEFGLKLYDPPVVGSSLNDIWQFGLGGWELKTIPGTAANFGAVLVAIPEPGTATLLGLGGLALFLRRRASGR